MIIFIYMSWGNKRYSSGEACESWDKLFILSLVVKLWLPCPVVALLQALHAWTLIDYYQFHNDSSGNHVLTRSPLRQTPVYNATTSFKEQTETDFFESDAGQTVSS